MSMKNIKNKKPVSLNTGIMVDGSGRVQNCIIHGPQAINPRANKALVQHILYLCPLTISTGYLV